VIVFPFEDELEGLALNVLLLVDVAGSSEGATVTGL